MFPLDVVGVQGVDDQVETKRENSYIWRHLGQDPAPNESVICAYVSWRQEMNQIIFSHYSTAMKLLWTSLRAKEELVRLEWDFKRSVTWRRSETIIPDKLFCSFQFVQNVRLSGIEFLIPTSGIDSDISSESVLGGRVKRQWHLQWNRLFIASCFSLWV